MVNNIKERALWWHIKEHDGISFTQARVIYDNIGWGFSWGKAKDMVVIISKPKHKKQLQMFRESVSKYTEVSNVIELPSSGDFAFSVDKSENIE